MKIDTSSVSCRRRRRHIRFSAPETNSQESSGEVPDEAEARLVILSPESAHIVNIADSDAMKSAIDVLEHRCSGPRNNGNTLVFLAADKTRLGDLDAAVRQHLAWKSICAENEKKSLNLDPFQTNQAETKATRADETVQARIPETHSSRGHRRFGGRRGTASSSRRAGGRGEGISFLSFCPTNYPLHPALALGLR